jgi:hypothetical protein
MVSYLFNAPGLPKTRAELEALRKRRDGAQPSGKMPSNVGEGLSFLGQAIAARILDGKLASAESAMGAADAGLQRGLLEAAYGGGGASDPAAAPAGSAFPAASPRLPNEIGGPDDRPPQTDLAAGIKETAQAIGADPLDLATVISYETGGTFDPTKAGPRTQWGRHRGLIQFGEPQAKQHGVDWNDPVGSQLGANGAVASYLKAAGYQPGMGLLDMYSAVNAGRVGRYDASDANNGGAPGTVRDKVEQQMADHRKKAMALLGAQPGPTRAATEAMSFAPGAPTPPAIEAVNAMAAGGALPTLPEPPPLAPTPTARPMTQGQPAPAPAPAAAMPAFNTAGMSYDPATGKIGAGASLNAGAKAMPAARAAFLGAGAPAGPNPIRGMIESVLGGGSAPATAPGATNPVTPAAMSGASASAPGDIMQRVIAAITDPNASEATRALGMSVLQQEIKRREGTKPEYGFTIAPDGTLIRTDKATGTYEPMDNFGKGDKNDGATEYGLNPQYGEDENGNPVLIQLGKNGSTTMPALPPGVKLRRDPIKIDTGTHWVLLDPITRQPIDKIEKDLAGEAAATAQGRVQGEATATAPANVSNADTALGLIEQLRDHPALNSRFGGVGVSSLGNIIPGTAGYDFQRLVEQVKGGAFLTAIQAMQGMGALSNAEGATATAALNRIDTGMSKEDFLKALGDYEAIVKRGRIKAQELLAKQGKMTAIPSGSPAPAAPAKVRRYNPATGQLEDVN